MTYSEIQKLRHSPVFWITAVVVFFAGVLAVMHWIAAIPSVQETLLRWDYEMRVKQINGALAKCTRADQCMGGFIVYRFKPVIARIENCERKCRPEVAIDLSDVQRRPVIIDYEEVQRIVLPDDKKWPGTAVRYAEQFTTSKKP